MSLCLRPSFSIMPQELTTLPPNPTEEPTDSAPAREIVSLNPSTLAEVGRVPICTRKDVSAAVVKARAAQPAWAALSFKERAKYILRAKTISIEGQDELCQLMSRENGKPVVETISSEILPVANLM